jgi:hypothetical protein
VKTLARESDRTELRARLRTVRPDSARRWGRMSAHQMVCHVGDALRLMAGEIPAGRVPRLHERTVVKWVALFAPLRWPAGIVTSPELDPDQGGTRPADFAADVAEVEALLERVLSSPESVEERVHPVFGRMTHATWLRWAWLHTDHHLRQFGA